MIYANDLTDMTDNLRYLGRQKGWQMADLACKRLDEKWTNRQTLSTEGREILYILYV